MLLLGLSLPTVAYAAIALLVVYALHPIARIKYAHIPGEYGLPLLGHLVQIMEPGIPDFCIDMYKKYGKVFKFMFGGRLWVVITDPDLGRKVGIRVNARVELALYYNILTGLDQEIAAKGLLEINGPLHKLARKGYEAELLNPSSLARHIPAMDSYAQKLCACLEGPANSGQVVDMWRELGNLSLAVVGQSAYGVDFGTLAGPEGASEEGHKLLEACKMIFTHMQVDKTSPYMGLSLVFPVLRPLFVALANALPDAKHAEHLAARQIIADTSRRLLKLWEDKVANGEVSTGAATDGPGLKRNSFMATMLANRGSDGDFDGRLTDVEVIAQVLLFIIAGYETTANALAATVYLLSVNPKAEARLVAEVKGRDLSTLGPEDADQFPYVDACVKEALRLLDPAAGIVRQSPEAMEINGLHIPANTPLYVPTWSLQRSEEYWPRAEEFLPQRFLPDGEAALGPRNPNAYMPFGVGGRMCVGYKFANLEARLALVRLYQRYHFELSPASQHPLKTKTGLTTGPKNGIKMVVSHRT